MPFFKATLKAIWISPDEIQKAFTCLGLLRPMIPVILKQRYQGLPLHITLNPEL